MTGDDPSSPKSSARILSFRRGREALRPHASSHVRDLAKYEGGAGPDDYRHRMLVNLAAFLFVVVLTCIGYWLADSMARMRKDHDCVLSGRRDCAPIHVVPQNRWQ